MRFVLSVVVVAVGLLLGPASLPVCAADDDGVALGILYDTSGSMRDPVPNAHGATSPKYVIANRALLDVVKQIQAYTTNAPADAPRKIDVGLFIFDKSDAKEVVKLAPFDASALNNFATTFSTPTGGTPLGNSLKTVIQAVLKSPQPRKHVLVITDGENTVGQGPLDTMVNQRARKNDAPVFVHFIAFDVDGKIFSALKTYGATVASAADEKELNSQLDFILQNQILLEKPSTK